MCPACRTWIYPGLSLTNYGCHETPSTANVYLTATLRTDPDSTGYQDQYPTVAAVSPLFVDSHWINAYLHDRAATPTTYSGDIGALGPTPSTPNDTYILNGSPSGMPSKNASSSTDAIVGGVIGGVVGAAGIGTAVFLFFLIQKKRQNQRNNVKSASGEAPQEMASDDDAPPLAICLIPQSEVEKHTSQQHANVEEDAADEKRASQPAVSRGDSELQQLYSQYLIAELPTHEDG